jgi:uncharacterized coiled-coil protein SlyX
MHQQHFRLTQWVDSIHNAAMKQCPECSAEYSDSISFCAKDGRALVAKVTSLTRLCPHCANSVPEDSANCPYCKADLTSSALPQWPTHERESEISKLAPKRSSLPLKSKIILVLGIAIFALGIYLIGGHQERSESQSVIHEKLNELQQKEQSIQEQEQKIQGLEKQLAEARQQLSQNDQELASLKTKLEESHKDLSVAQQRLTIANREVDRLASSRAQVASKAPSRPADPVSSSSPVAPARRVAEAGTYETVRSTAVYEGPSTSGRVLSQIGKGTRVDVLRSTGDWLEVRSKHGNPPGYIRWDDTKFVSK